MGVDINLAAHTPWQAAQVQFVPGMGPRKARELLKRVVQQEHVIARRDMLELFGRNKKVFWCVLRPAFGLSTAWKGALAVLPRLSVNCRPQVHDFASWPLALCYAVLPDLPM